ncbi:MAG: PadR family transcriptional regulator [Candidatus Limivicinus sp.]|jgi:DNA-binding PadR family transcriptional regulator
MDYIILGLLILKSRTIYELHERLDKGLNLMYSSSMGSIQAAIKKLLASGCIQYSELTEKGRRKKIYSVTESGRQKFLDWADGPLDVHNIRIPDLAKLYFMGFSAEDTREERLADYVEQLKQQYDALDAICREGENMEVPPGWRDIFQYQLLTAQYGRDIMKFNIQWYQKLIEEMRCGK